MITWHDESNAQAPAASSRAPGAPPRSAADAAAGGNFPPPEPPLTKGKSMSLDLSKLQAVADQLKQKITTAPAPVSSDADQAAVDALTSELEQLVGELDPTPPSTTAATDSGNSSVSIQSGATTAVSGVEGTGWSPTPSAG